MHYWNQCHTATLKMNQKWCKISDLLRPENLIEQILTSTQYISLCVHRRLIPGSELSTKVPVAKSVRSFATTAKCTSTQ